MSGIAALAAAAAATSKITTVPGKPQDVLLIGKVVRRMKESKCIKDKAKFSKKQKICGLR